MPTMAGVDSASAPGQAASPARIRIVLADDHQVVRLGLRLVLDGERDLEVVAEAGDIAEARQCARRHHPDVLVLDLNMPGEPTLGAIPGLLAEVPGMQIVVLTMQQDPVYAQDAWNAGVLGYVLKDAADTELVEAVRRAAAGETYLNPGLARRMVVDRTLGSAWD